MPTSPQTAKGAGYTVSHDPGQPYSFTRPTGSRVQLHTYSEASAWSAANRDWEMRRASPEMHGARALPTTINGYPLVAAIPHRGGELLCVALRADADPHPFVVWRLYVAEGEWIAATGFYADTLADALADMCRRAGMRAPVSHDA